jgi:hypothetical protein
MKKESFIDPDLSSEDIENNDLQDFDFSMRMGRIPNKNDKKYVPKSLKERIPNYNSIDNIFNDGEKIKFSKYYVINFGLTDCCNFYFGFIRSYKSKQPTGFNNQNPKLEFKALQVIVGPKYKPIEYYTGESFKDDDFEPIWDFLSYGNKTNINTANWLSSEYFGDLLRDKIKKVDRIPMFADVLCKLFIEPTPR